MPLEEQMGREKGTDKIEGGAFSGVNIVQCNPLFGGGFATISRLYFPRGKYFQVFNIVHFNILAICGWECFFKFCLFRGKYLIILHQGTTLIMFLSWKISSITMCLF